MPARIKDYEPEISGYYNTPRDENGRSHEDLEREFSKEKADKPLRKHDLERSVNSFILKNWKKILPIVLKAAGETTLDVLSDEILLHFDIDQQFLAQMGTGLELIEEDSSTGSGLTIRKKIASPEGRFSYHRFYDSPDSVENQLALAYLRSVMNIHTTPDNNSPFPHRFYFQPIDRYLSSNDYGMKSYNKEVNSWQEGDVTSAEQIILTFRDIFRKIIDNIRILRSQSSLEQTSFEDYLTDQDQQILKKLESELERIGEDLDRKSEESGEQNRNLILEYNEARYKVDRYKTYVRERGIARRIEDIISKNPKLRNIILTAMPGNYALSKTWVDNERIAKYLGLVTSNPVEDYQRFKREGRSLVSELVIPDTSDEIKKAGLQVVYIKNYRKPVIVSRQFRPQTWIDKASSNVGDYLAKRIVDSDPEISDLFSKYHCTRGPNSPYFYGTNQLLEFIQELGIENANHLLSEKSDVRQIHELLLAFTELRDLGYDFYNRDLDWVKKQIHEIGKLRYSGIWQYLFQREGKRHSSNSGNQSSNLKALFVEGKRMYWLASQIWQANPERETEDRFWQSYQIINWEKYDLSELNISADKIRKYLSSNINLISYLLNLENLSPNDQDISLKRILLALESGQDLRGLAIASDKGKYLEDLLKPLNEDRGIKFTIKDWPEELQQQIEDKELEIYYEYANDYIRSYPDGLLHYAQLKLSLKKEDIKLLDQVVVNDKEDLDFKLLVSLQSEEVLSWYLKAVERVGAKTIRKYLSKVQETREQNGRFSNLHDSLMWARHADKLIPGDLKSVLLSVRTMDSRMELNNNLPRYDSQKDPFLDHGRIQSILELKKRVIAIESNIDLTDVPEEILDVTVAPGFDLSALDRMMNYSRESLDSLLAGEIKQPFESYTMKIRSKTLTQSLREALDSRVKGLYEQLENLVSDRVYKGKRMKASDLIEYIPEDLEETILSLLEEKRVDLGVEVVAKLHDKSDPEGWVCGNYTDCCMPFGDPKNDDYMFNPGTQYFTISYNGRIIAQSVVVNATDTETGEDVILLDNIEVANNYTKLNPIIDLAYRRFWSTYSSKGVKIGSANSDLILQKSKLENNNIKPKHSLVHSDATGPRIYSLSKEVDLTPIDEVVTFSNVSQRDAYLMADIEKKSYPDEMVLGVDAISEVINKTKEMELPGAASSFLVRKGKEVVGYVLILPEESSINPEELVIYVNDMVILPQYRGQGIAREMMERVLDIAESYSGQIGTFQGTIEADARESTSYAMLINQRVRDWYEERGFKLTQHHKKEGYLGGEDFYFVRLEKVN